MYLWDWGCPNTIYTRDAQWHRHNIIICRWRPNNETSASTQSADGPMMIFIHLFFRQGSHEHASKTKLKKKDHNITLMSVKDGQSKDVCCVWIFNVSESDNKVAVCIECCARNLWRSSKRKGLPWKKNYQQMFVNSLKLWPWPRITQKLLEFTCKLQ